MYIDKIRSARIALFAYSILGFSVAVVCILFYHFAGTDFTDYYVAPSIIDDVSLLFFVVISVVNFVNAWFYPRLYAWVWYSGYYVNLIAMVVAIIIFIEGISLWTIWCDDMGFLAIMYGFLSFIAFFHFHSLKIKALFRRWK